MSIPPVRSPALGNFIDYTLHRTRLHTSVTFAVLYLLQRLNARFPAACGSSGHHLFISTFMVASKVICDDTYSNMSRGTCPYAIGYAGEPGGARACAPNHRSRDLRASP
ncbi:hypothetical protein TRAPUB_7389 [Trametes pubescens]|uniref:Uncharacterized protein n=1 Tax=Trametes pubescens TaxID=154538 RepID=A0A1M2V3R2_TRAPU|nr:hypothetical protein TRAPUB_7389 [Trametes pubescens]